jgi:hypothetical protein
VSTKLITIRGSCASAQLLAQRIQELRVNARLVSSLNLNSAGNCPGNAIPLVQEIRRLVLTTIYRRTGVTNAILLQPHSAPISFLGAA